MSSNSSIDLGSISEQVEESELRNTKATHEGKITIGENELNVAVLEDGTRIITQSAVFRAFGRTKRGRAKDDVRVLNRPAFIDANNLQPFIDEGLDAVLTPIDYETINGSDSDGFNAEILPRLCKVYLINSISLSAGCGDFFL